MTVHEIVLLGSQDGEDMLTVLHYDMVNFEVSELQDFADNISLLMIPDLQDNLVTSVRYSGIRVREDIPGGVGTVVSFTAGDIVGTSTGPDLMKQTAFLIRKEADSLVRPTQGRVYQGGVHVGALGSTGFWDATVGQQIQDFWNSMISISFGTTGQADMVIKASNPTAPNTQPYSPVARMVRILNPSTQRRRRIASGS